jgi:hypothetical protein
MRIGHYSHFAVKETMSMIQPIHSQSIRGKLKRKGTPDFRHPYMEWCIGSSKTLAASASRKQDNASRIGEAC